jgi:hypothetical protein
MSIFKQDREIKRMIFNVYADLAERIETLKAEARKFDKRLDVDAAVNKALDKFVKKAEKKLEEVKREHKDKRATPRTGDDAPGEASGCAREHDPQSGGQPCDPSA